MPNRSNRTWEPTFRNLSGNCTSLFFGTAIPAGVHALVTRHETAKNDKLYTILPLLSVIALVAVTGILIKELTDLLLECAFPRDPNDTYKYAIDRNLFSRSFRHALVTGHNINEPNSNRSSNNDEMDSNASNEKVPFIGNKSTTCKINKNNLIRGLVVSLLAIGLTTAGINYTLKYTPGQNDQFYKDVPSWVTTLAIVFTTLMLRAGLNYVAQKCCCTCCSANPQADYFNASPSRNFDRLINQRR